VRRTSGLYRESLLRRSRVAPNGRRVGIRIVTFEACSGFTHVTAHRIAQPPKAAFVARLQPSQLPNQAARQLPDQSTTIRVEPFSTDDSRFRGALPIPDFRRRHSLRVPGCRLRGRLSVLSPFDGNKLDVAHVAKLFTLRALGPAISMRRPNEIPLGFRLGDCQVDVDVVHAVA
jgi:hypothetical protein